EQDRRLALVTQLRRVDELGARRHARSRCNREVLLAIDLERHGRRGEARSDVDLPQLVEWGVVKGGNRAIKEGYEDHPAGGRERARVVWVFQVHVLFDFARKRIDGGQIALPAVGGSREAAVPALLLVVLLAVDRDVHASRQSRDVDQLRV